MKKTILNITLFTTLFMNTAYAEVLDKKVQNFIEKYYGVIDEDLFLRVAKPIDEVVSFFSFVPNFQSTMINSSIIDMDSKGMTSGMLIDKAWSYHRFNTLLGNTAYRYADPKTVASSNWDEKYKIFSNNKTDELIDENKIDELSPIEKYEYLIGSHGFPLTQSEWSKGIDAKNAFGEIPSWFGFCHGTAPASIIELRPKKTVSVRSYDGKHLIHFYPSDIKALLGFAWAQKPNYSTIIGKRCYEEDATGKNVLTLSERCYDPNPGSFHLSIVNAIKKLNTPILIDSHRATQIWNKPIIGYKYYYFDVNSPSKLSHDLQSSMVKKENYKNDPYKEIRRSNCDKIVGIQIELMYPTSTSPSKKLTDSTQNDVIQSVSYKYDLELDDDGNILGGVWLSDNSPDFIWSVTKQNLPFNQEDLLVGAEIKSFNHQGQLPLGVQELATGSAHRSEVLYKVIDRLNELSQK
jgi:hypothetical protein